MNIRQNPCTIIFFFFFFFFFWGGGGLFAFERKKKRSYDTQNLTKKKGGGGCVSVTLFYGVLKFRPLWYHDPRMSQITSIIEK